MSVKLLITLSFCQLNIVQINFPAFLPFSNYVNLQKNAKKTEIFVLYDRLQRRVSSTLKLKDHE